MPVHFTPIPTAVARAYQSGAPDANGQLPERHVADGDGNPCRHCLQMIAQGAGMLVLAHRPFPAPQPMPSLVRSSCAPTRAWRGAERHCPKS